MSRWSPTVLPTAAPSAIAQLADALGAGVQSKEHFDSIHRQDEDRRLALEDRNLALKDRETSRRRQANTDFMNHIRPPGYVDPSTPAPGVPAGAPSSVRGPMPDDGLEGQLQGQGPEGIVAAPPAPRSDSGHPGGYSSAAGGFVPVQRKPLAPLQLPDGSTYDREGAYQQREGEAAATRQAALAAELEKQRAGSMERERALRGLQQSGRRDLTDAMIAAGAQDPQVFQDLVRNKKEAWVPTTREERVKVHNEEAEGSAAATARHRSAAQAGLGAALHAGVQVGKQITDNDRATRTQEKAVEKAPLDMALTATDSTNSRRATAALERLRARGDSLTGVRDRLNAKVTAAALGEELPGETAGDRTGTTSGQPAKNATGFPKATQDEYNRAADAAGGNPARIALELKKMKRS